MNTTIAKTQSFGRTALIDVVLLTVACLVPTLSHLFALPLYHLNPMLLVLLAGMLLVSDKRNAFLLAVLLPVVSMVAVGMPTPLKALCMVPELLTVALVSSLLISRSHSYWTMLGSMVAAMLCGKVVYYALKALVLSPAVLISTPVLTQLVVVMAAAAIFAAFARK